MKILFVHNRYRQQGGEDIVFEHESSLLKEKGHDVRLLIFDNKDIEGFFFKIISFFNSIYNFSSAKKMGKTIHEFNPDIVHVHNTFFVASPSILKIAHKRKVPVVLTLHNYRLICANAIFFRENKICEQCINRKFPFAGIKHKCYRRSALASSLVTIITSIHKYLNTWKKNVSAFISINEFARNKFINSSLQLPPERIITKSNFTPDPGEGNQQREDFFLFMGRIVNEKGVDILLKAFSTLPEKKLIIIGDGEESELLIKQYASNKNISFKGYLPKLEAETYLKKCKALICPSMWHEGPPLIIIEAFATGTPVICSQLSTLTEAVKDHFNGFFFNSGDSEDLKRKINILEQSIRDDNQLYVNARQTYIEKFHPDIHYNAIMNIYKTSINKNA